MFAVATVLVTAAAVSCSDLSSLTGGSGPGEDAGGDGDSIIEGGATDAVSDAGAGGDAAFASDCGANMPGPSMVRVGSYCIDSTEVTNAQYRVFLESPGTLVVIPECTGNATFVPAYGWPAPTNELNLPVTGVDWCDAYAFCVSAGKRLCGAIDGGATPPAQGNDPNVSQWYRACAGPAARAYPYGDSYDAARCNGTSGVRKDAGSLPGCTTLEHANLFDLSGNVYEWEDLCTSSAPDAGCRVRGGSNSDSTTALRCDSTFTPPRDYAVAPIGFRCCTR
jgi:formylglycine-generating enzyme required for sulfatase activity